MISMMIMKVINEKVIIQNMLAPICECMNFLNA